MIRDDFAIFIMSYKRPNNIYTLNTLQKSNYTGKYYIIVSDDDPCVEQYQKLYGNIVKVFNKQQILNEMNFDLCDCGGSESVILYARNYCFKLAKELDLKYFAEFDDDYTSFEYRYAKDNKLKVLKSKEFDEVCNNYINFLEDTKASTVAFAQGGDLIGGVNGSKFKQRVLRKAMNSFFFKTDNDDFLFFGRLNEDVNAYVQYGKIGKLLLTAVDCSLVQKPTQKTSGGMTETYNNGGTYLKSFYTVMINPSCVKIAMMNCDNPRIHHRIDWNKAVPKILSDRYKKI